MSTSEAHQNRGRTRRYLYRFSTPAGTPNLSGNDTRAGNSSNPNYGSALKSAIFHHWGVFVTSTRFDVSSAPPSLPEGVFFELDRPGQTGVGCMFRTTDQRVAQEQGKAKWDHFEETDGSTVWSDKEIYTKARSIAYNDMPKGYHLTKANCQNFTNMLVNAIAEGDAVYEPRKTVGSTIFSKMSRALRGKETTYLTGLHESDQAVGTAFGSNRVVDVKTPATAGAAAPVETIAQRREAYRQYAQNPVPPPIPGQLTDFPLRFTMSKTKRFNVEVRTISGVQDFKVKHVEAALTVSHPSLFGRRSVKPDYDRQQLMIVLRGLAGPGSIIGLSIDFSEARKGPKGRKNLDDVLERDLDLNGLEKLRKTPETYDIGHGWTAEEAPKSKLSNSVWHVVLRFKPPEYYARDLEADKKAPVDQKWLQQYKYQQEKALDGPTMEFVESHPLSHQSRRGRDAWL